MKISELLKKCFITATIMIGMDANNAFAMRPGEDLDWGVDPKPRGVHWEIMNGQAHSRTGLGTFNIQQTGIGGLYRIARQAGVPAPIIFGVHDNAGNAWIGGRWGINSKDDIAFQREKVSVTFVGLSDHAEVTAILASSNSGIDPTGTVRFYNIGLRGIQDAFVIRANAQYDKLLMDGCWYLNGLPEGQLYDAGIHTDNFDQLIIRNHKWRGKYPRDPGLNIRRHAVAYIKSGRGSILLENNNLFGGNQTGFQIRPDRVYQSVPTARVMIRNNYCYNCGSNFVMGDGGGAMTAWVSSNGLYIYDNVLENFRFSALVVSGQTMSTNFNFLPSGNQHKDVFISGNRFIRGPQTERDTASFSSIDYLRLYHDNTMNGKVVLDSTWNHNNNGTTNVTEEFYFNPTAGDKMYNIFRGQQKISAEEYRSKLVLHRGI